MAVAVPYLINLGISVAISYVAGKLLAKDPDGSVTKDFKATPLTDRGSPIARVIGRDIVGPCMTWAGDRTSKTESGGGKGVGGGSPDGQVIWFEDGWHVLCIGPARRLWSIVQNGKTIFVGPIDSASHPSGTLIDLDSKGKFRIWWGEADQPANTRLGNADALGITSRWPHLCYVEWVDKRLGPSPVWPRLSYEIEVWPYHTKLVATPSWFAATRTLVGDPLPLDTSGGSVMDGPPGTNFITLETPSNDFKATQYARLVDCGVADGDYLIDHVGKFKVGDNKFRRIYFGQTMVGLNATGFSTAQPYVDDLNDGVNGAHAIYEMLFSGMPHGKGLPLEVFDLTSLENVGLLCQSEALRSTILAVDFKQIDAALGELLLDLGVAIVLEPSNGLLTFRPIRETVDVVVFSADMITGTPVEVNTTQIDEVPSTRKQFQFRDRTRNYTPMPVTIDDDGQAELEAVFGQSPIDLATVRDFTTASTIAQRRNQEAYSNEQLVRVKANREAPLVSPGRLISIPDLDTALLVMESERTDSQSGEVQLGCIPNYYGVPASTAVIDDGGGLAGSTEEADEDSVFIPLEVPQSINDDGVVELAVARIRSAATVTGGLIHLSPDDTTFTLLGTEAGVHTGGQLTGAVAADGPSFLDIGPTITAAGPDITHAQDLSAAGSKGDWQRGLQCAAVWNGTDYELWFVRWLEALGGNQFRLREVLRHRLCTPKLAFATGDWVVLFPRDDIKKWQSLALLPLATDYVKSQPVGNADIPLDSIVSEPITLYGQGVRPLPVTALRAGDAAGRCSNSFSFPNDVSIRWGYRQKPGPTLSSPAGLPAGDPVLVRPESDGTVRVQIVDPTGPTVVRTTDLPLDTLAELIYTQAQIKTDFGLSPGYSPGTIVMKWKSAATSPSPTGVSNLTGDHVAGSLASSTSTATPLNVVVGGFNQERAVAITAAGVPGLSVWPGGNHTVVVTFPPFSTFPNGTDANWKVSAAVARFSSTNVLQDTGAFSATQTVGDGTFTFTCPPPAGPWSGASNTDRFGIILFFEKNTGGNGIADIEADSGTSYVSGPLFDNAAIDFDVEVSVIKGSQQSSVEIASIENLGGTTT